MSLNKKQFEFTKDVASLIFYANLIGIDLTFGHAYRDKETQQRMVDTGKAKP